MALNILTKQSGSTYDQSNSTLTAKSVYRIPEEIWIAIRSSAPSRGIAPAASRITSADIEAQRQAFVAKFGSDGLEPITN